MRVRARPMAIRPQLVRCNATSSRPPKPDEDDIDTEKKAAGKKTKESFRSECGFFFWLVVCLWFFVRAGVSASRRYNCVRREPKTPRHVVLGLVAGPPTQGLQGAMDQRLDWTTSCPIVGP